MLQQAGDATVGGKVFPVFQCDECLSEVKMFGEPVEVAYTFALDEAGNPFDPSADGEDEPA